MTGADLSIHFVIGAFPPSLGGAQLHTHALARELAGRGVGVRVSCLWRETRHDWVRGSTTELHETTERVVEDGITIDRVGLEHGPWERLVAAAYYGLRRTAARHFAARLRMERGAEDVCHVVRLGREHLALRAFDDAAAGGIPVALTPNHHPRWTRRPDPVWRDLYRRADHLFALTEAERDALIALGAAPERVTITGIGPILADRNIPTRQELEKSGVPGSSFVLFLGQQYPYKRVDLAIDAFELLARDHRELSLVIAGPVSPRTEKLVAGSKARDRIRVFGAVDLETKTALLTHAVALVHPSEQEAFGGVLIEAASVGTPYVAGDVPAMAAVTRRIGGGVTADRAAESIAAALDRVLTEPPAVDAGALEALSWPSLAQSYLDVYTRLADA